MDIRVLDRNYNIVDLVQDFESFIWTERYDAYGDFELIVAARMRWLIQPDYHIYIEESNYLMIVDSVEKVRSDEEGKDLIKVLGRSAEALLENRLVTPSRSAESWTHEGATAGAIATWLVRKICVYSSGFSSLDRIENLTAPDATHISAVVADVEFNNSTTLYEAVQSLCESDNLGFRVRFNLAAKSYEFRVYRGTDRRDYNTTRPLIFDEEHQTLSNTRWLKSRTEHKNVAYVSHSDRANNRIVYLPGMTVTAGRARKVLFVNANDIEEPTPAKLDQRGREELAKHVPVDAFDGEAIPNADMVYNRNYAMGDMGIIRGNDGTERTVIVAEHTWTYDADGIRSYPTFKTLEGVTL